MRLKTLRFFVRLQRYTKNCKDKCTLQSLKLEVTLHTIFSDCKNLQKHVLTNVNIQRTGKTSLQMFVYFIFDGSFICSCLYIFRPSSVPRHSFCPLQLEAYTLIINDLYLQILHSASESETTLLRLYLLQPIWSNLD